MAAAEGVCVVTLSVAERHGHHLAMGTDTYTVRDIYTRATALETVVVFPDMIFARQMGKGCRSDGWTLP